MNQTSTGALHFSSKSSEWSTPQWLYDSQNTIYNFTLDPCSTRENAKCAKYYTQAEDGLRQDWSKDRVWMNPPYGRAIGAWMRKAYEESLRGALVVCLVPARTDTNWWHDYAVKGRVVFIRGRLKFGGHSNSAPFPSALVVFQAEQFRVARVGRDFDGAAFEGDKCAVVYVTEHKLPRLTQVLNEGCA